MKSKDMDFASAAALPAVVLTAMHAVNLAGAHDLQGRGPRALSSLLDAEIILSKIHNVIFICVYWFICMFICM